MARKIVSHYHLGKLAPLMQYLYIIHPVLCYININKQRSIDRKFLLITLMYIYWHTCLIKKLMC